MIYAQILTNYMHNHHDTKSAIPSQHLSGFQQHQFKTFFLANSVLASPFHQLLKTSVQRVFSANAFFAMLGDKAQH